MVLASQPGANPALRLPVALSGAFARHPLGCALLLGALAACGFRPLALWPLALLGVAGLFALVARTESWRRAGLIGWLWGVAHFTLGNNWIATAFTYQAKMPMWLGWVSVLLLSLYLAVYPALAALGGWLFRRVPGAMVPAFAGCWIIGEALRGWVLTGFPWNPLGVALLGDFAHPGLAGLARWTGAYGLSGLAALLAGMMVLGAARLFQRRDTTAWLLVAGPLALVAAAMHWPAAGDTAAGTIPYTLVQPNIPQAQLDDPLWFEAQFIKTAQLTLPRPGEAGGQAPGKRLVLWPESGVPDYLRDGYPAWAYRETTYDGDPALARARIARVIGPQAVLLTGSVDLDLARDKIGGEMGGDRLAGARNVVTAVDGRGRIAGGYTKAHLVPYGEYLPLRWLMKPLGLARLVPGDMDFTAGPGPRTLDLGPLGKAGIQICYEIVFSGAVVDAAHRPDYIFNPSNDGWFGDWGPPQHLAQARLRAIEEGLPVLRSTTNGVSAVVNADGVVLHAAPRGVAARFDGLIPPAHAPTLFARVGVMLSLYWAIALLAASLLVLRRRRG